MEVVDVLRLYISRDMRDTSVGKSPRSRRFTMRLFVTIIKHTIATL